MTDSCGSQLISALIMKTLLNQELFFCLMQLSLSSTAWKGESRNISSSSLTLFPSLTSFPVCHSSALAALVIIWCTYCSLLTWQLSVWLLGSSSLNESLNENVVILCSPSLGFFHSVLFSFVLFHYVFTKASLHVCSSGEVNFNSWNENFYHLNPLVPSFPLRILTDRNTRRKQR